MMRPRFHQAGQQLVRAFRSRRVFFSLLISASARPDEPTGHPRLLKLSSYYPRHYRQMRSCSFRPFMKVCSCSGKIWRYLSTNTDPHLPSPRGGAGALVTHKRGRRETSIVITDLNTTALPFVISPLHVSRLSLVCFFTFALVSRRLSEITPCFF